MYQRIAIALMTGWLMAPVAGHAQIDVFEGYDAAEDAAMGTEKKAYFQDHLQELRRESQSYPEPVRKWQVLPPQYTLYEIPPLFGRPDVRYTVLDGHVVLVNPETRMIVRVVD